ncbi:hypothetical protein K3495_g14782, partial [Podosphaera aphanis]
EPKDTLLEDKDASESDSDENIEDCPQEEARSTVSPVSEISLSRQTASTTEQDDLYETTGDSSVPATFSSVTPGRSNNSEPQLPSEENLDIQSSSLSVETPDASNVRRSSRMRKQIEPRSAWQPRPRALYVGGDITIPQNYKEAVGGPNKSNWQIAIDEELDSLSEKNVFTPVTHVPHDRKPIGSRWVFTVKSDGRFKARLVAQGFSQIHGVDYFDTYSPTLRMDSLRILLAVATFNDWEIDQVDVKTAYLEGDLDEVIFMRSPEGMKTTKYVRLNKSLYGLKQSGKAWYEKLDNRLTNIGFKKSDCDGCVYIHLSNRVVVGVYVDDLVICGSLVENVRKLKEKLTSYFPIKDLGPIQTIIGWKVYRDRSRRILKITQAPYIHDKINSFGLKDAKKYESPMEGYSGLLPAREDEQPADESAYPSAIGSLGYAANSTRPDISFATYQLARFNASPAVRHWKSACRVFRYLKATEDYCITYNFGPSTDNITDNKMAVIYSDSDYASDVSTRRSVSGYSLMLGGGPVCWQSKRQKSVATSTTEAEYIALFEASKQAIWVSRFLRELHVEGQLVGKNGMLVYTDNQSALALARGTNSTKAKHIDVAYHFSRNCVNDGTIRIEYIPTEDMLADILTKPLSPSRTKALCRKIFQRK